MAVPGEKEEGFGEKMVGNLPSILSPSSLAY